MTAPIAIELVADSPSDAETSRALVEACSDAAGAGGCVLGSTLDDATPPRARVFVVFSDGTARVHVRVVATESGAGLSREAAFHDGDPPRERFRAAGLIAAGLVAAAEATATEPGIGAEARAPAPLPSGAGRTLVRAGAGIGWTAERPWVYGQLGADFMVGQPLIVSLSGGYGRTSSRDDAGVAEQWTSFGAGPGVAVPLPGGAWSLHAHLEAEIQRVVADVTQPSTGLQDEGGRTFVGVGAAVEIVVPVAGGLGLFVGDRVDFWGSRTAVRVAGAPVETIGTWLETATAGLTVRIP
jgi:hypothetical protein